MTFLWTRGRNWICFQVTCEGGLGERCFIFILKFGSQVTSIRQTCRCLQISTRGHSWKIFIIIYFIALSRKCCFFKKKKAGGGHRQPSLNFRASPLLSSPEAIPDSSGSTAREGCWRAHRQLLPSSWVVLCTRDAAARPLTHPNPPPRRRGQP